MENNYPQSGTSFGVDSLMKRQRTCRRVAFSWVGVLAGCWPGWGHGHWRTDFIIVGIAGAFGGVPHERLFYGWTIVGSDRGSAHGWVHRGLYHIFLKF